MHVRFKISHANHPGPLTGALEAQFGPCDPHVLDRSVVFPESSRGVIVGKLAYAVETDTYRLLVVRGSNADLDVILEETPHARLMAEAQAVWDRLRTGLKALSLRPQLRSASVNAEARDVAMAEGSISRRAHLLTESVVIPAVSLVLLCVFVAVASQTFAQTTWPTMLIGAVPLLANVLYFGIRGIRRAVIGSIVWRLARDVDA